MNRRTARRIADALTWARIISVVPITILAWFELKWWVLVLYVGAALTDLLDGWFARRGDPPMSNIDFDGIADIVLRGMTLLWLWLLIPDFFQKYWLPYIPILVLLELFMISIRLRQPDMKVPHFQFGRYAMALKESAT